MNVLYGVRTILVLGYWVLDDIGQYWVVSVLGDILLVVIPSTDT